MISFKLLRSIWPSPCFDPHYLKNLVAVLASSRKDSVLVNKQQFSSLLWE